MLEELGGASPKISRPVQKWTDAGAGRPQCFRVPQLGVSSKKPAERRSNLGWAKKGPPGSRDLGGLCKAETVPIQMD